MLKQRLLVLSLSLALPLSAASMAAAQGAAPNQLTEAEKKEGWELLFDGKGVQSWRGYQKPDMTGLRWIVQDGCLALPPSDGTDTRGERDIISTSLYGDFDLAWEWRISLGGNSGVKYLVTEGRPAALGHEYQVIDDARHADAAKRDSRRTGSFYDVLAAPAAKPRPAGEFNQSRILLKGNHVEHWLNGAKILEYELDSDALRKAIADSKFKEVEGFDKAKRGHILLQDHGNAVCYRNLKIRELR
jgi:hypothetical protein